ncbi:MAG: tRNA 5-methoxyuridine(34)/uridine 5-oxyacetic acid(34) synthase CmoB [Pseudomonadota bacterium]
MLDLDRAFVDLEAAGLSDWSARLRALIEERISARSHGDMPAWLAAIDALPETAHQTPRLDVAAVGAAELDLAEAEAQSATDALLGLNPWRKGPFQLGPIHIDSEWRSDLKWERVAGSITSLHGRRVLDVGCGNGYYALRMFGAGARTVIGIDPTLRYLAQFAAVTRFLEPVPVHVLPLRLEELPRDSRGFDTVFSMGVLYHSPSPIEHLRLLRGALKPGGELVLETLILPGEEALSRTPESRYARMRNVWHLPTRPELLNWLGRTGFHAANVADITATTTDEQRSTRWMTFDSLAAALQPDDPSRTVEGWPAPLRAVVIAQRQ